MRDQSIHISGNIYVHETEMDITASRSGGPGGQHVNKVSSAIHLRFNIQNSSLPEICKRRLMRLKDKRITDAGEIIIRAREHKSQIKNREAAIERLIDLIRSALIPRKKRKPTRPNAAAREKRLEVKNKRSKTKALRKKIKTWD